MASNWKGILTVGGVVGIAVVAGLYALQVRETEPAPAVALESGGVTVYKTPT
ncbi:MAG: hypothetical protein GTO46_03665 [Gemmatimonadetes bacterium]|nr:hypothetical protein [Gemmatimonadota bacterium]NIO32898.1 hypothetical protein [Gemmatimonadota bacterium]